ncbi:MAG: hypothetical protein DRP78_06340 [Candidatus Omnitrophota bacterium]|nr:MAG: hypothetical protein DRP78_06340 [Candidatus Omnitrophota bacterium]
MMENINFGVLLLLGIGIFGGSMGAWIFHKLRIPQVIGYIVIGILIGQSGLHIIEQDTILNLQAFNWFALGLIGFLVGGELKAAIFHKYGRDFISILLGEGLVTFILVSVSISLVVFYWVHNIAAAVAAGVVFGAIASATDPASTINVLWEYRARGILTTALIAVVALDDALAMTLYGLGKGLAEILVGGSTSIGHELIYIVMELGGSIALGFITGIILKLFILRLKERKDEILAIAIGMLLLVIGFSSKVGMDIILATMTMGVTLVNFLPKRSTEIFVLIRSFASPIYIVFFVLVGARLSISNMPFMLWVIVGIYVIARTIGKMSGAYLGAKIVNADPVIQKYTGLGLFAQGGVAIGLSIMASQHLNNIQITESMSLGDMIIFGVTASTLIVQFLGPPMVKLAVKLAGEINKNITEDDIMNRCKVGDVMEKGIIPIKNSEKISNVFQMFSENKFIVYPVIDQNFKIIGTISLENLKDILIDQNCWQWMVAQDALVPAKEIAYIALPLKNAIVLMSELNLEYMAVVDDLKTRMFAGILDIRYVRKFLKEELIRELAI